LRILLRVWWLQHDQTFLGSADASHRAFLKAVGLWPFAMQTIARESVIT
jgi:hypothetical protein